MQNSKTFTNGVEQIVKNFTGKIESVLEIGSADGDDANFLAEEYGVDPTNVHIVEPRPNAVQFIKSKYPNYNVYEVAISNYDQDSVSFNLAEDEEISSLLSRSRDNHLYVNSIQVRVMKFSSLAKERNIDSFDLVKIDTEGCTFEVLQGFEDLINKVKVFHIEVEKTDFWKNQKLKNEVLSLLTGFTIVYSNELEQEDIILVNNSLL